VRSRRGAAAVFGAVLTLSLVMLVAITLDFNHIHVAETEMSRAVDSAAMAGCWELFDQKRGLSSVTPNATDIHQESDRFTQLNPVGNSALALSEIEDVEIGTYYADQPGQLDQSDPVSYNAVRVTLRRNSSMNGELPLFFGQVTGRDSQSLRTQATAAMLQAIKGFELPDGSGETIEMLPFALDLPSWQATVAGHTEDNFVGTSSLVSAGCDGICETNLYPQGTGAPGNRGTVDIGGQNNTTDDIARQIMHGISKQDMIDLGKPLEFVNGVLDLNGDTGISAGVKDELASIIGQTRMIPIFQSVDGNGNNAMFHIVALEGVRILDVKLTGKKNKKRVIIQPANVLARHAKIDYSGEHQSSHVYAPVMLVD
jgi:hypothetical protein